MANKAKKIDINKQGLNNIKNPIVKKNLMGVSDSMKKKDWTDSQGRKGKVRGHRAISGVKRILVAAFICLHLQCGRRRS